MHEIIETAEFDILRDSGKKFAERLTSSGTQVFYSNYPGLIHSFLQFSGVITEAEIATTETAQLLGNKIRE